MRLGKLAGHGAAAAERTDVLRLARVLVDEIRPVAVGDVDVAIRRDGDVGRVVVLLHAVGTWSIAFGVRWSVDSPDDLAGQGRLDHRGLNLRRGRRAWIRSVHGEVQEFDAAFAPDVETVRDAAELAAPRSNEPAI